MSRFVYAREPRAEELVAEIYNQLTACKAKGMRPAKVYLPIAFIRRLRIYHALLGKTSDPIPDYLERNNIFGLEYFVHDSESIIVSE